MALAGWQDLSTPQLDAIGTAVEDVTGQSAADAAEEAMQFGFEAAVEGVDQKHLPVVYAGQTTSPTGSQREGGFDVLEAFDDRQDLGRKLARELEFAGFKLEPQGAGMSGAAMYEDEEDCGCDDGGLAQLGEGARVPPGVWWGLGIGAVYVAGYLIWRRTRTNGPFHVRSFQQGPGGANDVVIYNEGTVQTLADAERLAISVARTLEIGGTVVMDAAGTFVTVIDKSPGAEPAVLPSTGAKALEGAIRGGGLYDRFVNAPPRPAALPAPATATA